MNKQETIKIIAMLKVAYPKFFVSEDKEERKLQVDTWQSLFDEEPYALVEQAVKALMCTLQFPPTVADIKGKIALITQPEETTELEAWSMVWDAIKSANYNSQQNFERLPPVIRKVVGSPNQLREWAMMDSETVNSVIQSNFMRSYKAKVAQQKEYDRLPASTKQLMSGLADKFKMIGDGEE